MPPLFERISKNLVKELGDKDLRPVKCPLEARKFQQFSLLRKRRKTGLQFWEQSDIPVDYSLMDILEPSSPVPETVVTGPFLFSDTVVLKLKALMDVTAGLEMTVRGEAAQSHRASLQFRSVAIPPKTWEGLQKRKVLDQKLLFLEEFRNKRYNLYVVTEAVELINQTVLQDKGSMTVLGRCRLPWTTRVQGEGEGAQERDRTLALPQGTVMAYKKKQLVFKENGWNILLISDDETQATFPEVYNAQRSLTISSDTLRGPILPVGRIQQPFSHDFKYLQEEVSWEMEALAQLSKDTQDAVFHTILKDLKLKDRRALQDFMDMLDGDPLAHADGFGGTFLSEMGEDLRNSWSRSRSHIIYILDAIMALNDTQHELLAQSMEKRILLQQRELVRSILEPNFKYPLSIPFRLEPELLAQLQEDGVAVTFALLQECGLRMEPGSPKATWDLEAKKPLCALYAALSGLQQLVGA